MARVKISPDKAALLLTICDPDWERHERPTATTKYARDMKNGYWQYSADPILVLRRKGESDRLINGQHRLKAVVKADVPVEFELRYTDDVTAFEVVDSGVARTHADFLRMRGMDNPSALSSAARLLWKLNEFQGGLRVPPSNTDLDKVIEETRGSLGQTVEMTKDRRRKIPLNTINPGVMSVFDYLISSANAEEAFVFWTKLMSPNSLTKMDPLRQLYDRLEQTRTSPNRQKTTIKVQLAYLIKAWNQWRAADDTTRLVYKINDRYPTLV